MRGLLSGKEPCSVRSTDANVGQKGFKTGHALEKRTPRMDVSMLEAFADGVLEALAAAGGARNVISSRLKTFIKPIARNAGFGHAC